MTETENYTNMEEAKQEEDTFHFDTLQGHIKEYINTKIEYFKLSVIEYIARIMPVIAFIAILSILLLLFWIFANYAAALAIGDAIGSETGGICIIAALNLLLAIIFSMAYKRMIFKPVSNFTVKILLKSLEEDENK